MLLQDQPLLFEGVSKIWWVVVENKSTRSTLVLFVPRERLELSCLCRRQLLRLVCLPIPPPRLIRREELILPRYCVSSLSLLGAPPHDRIPHDDESLVRTSPFFDLNEY